MATLTLKKKTGGPSSHRKSPGKPGGPRSAAGDEQPERRKPLRGAGVSRVRPTLEQAQKERAERQAAYEARKAQAERSARAGRPDAPSRPARPSGPTERFGKPVDARFEHGTGRRRGDADMPSRERQPMGEGNFGRHPDDRFNDSFDERFRARPRDRFENRGAGQAAPQAAPVNRRPDERHRPPYETARRDQRRTTGPHGGFPAHPREERDEYASGGEAEGLRLSKRLSELGMASRREADEWIEAGWVRVDGKLAVLGQRVAPDAKIEIDPAAHKQQAQRVTILINKPIGYVSGQAEDGYEPASVLIKTDTHWEDDASGLKYHIGHSRGLAPAGRLDIDSTGLLVLTQDGRIAKALIGEDSQIEKEYLVRVEYVGLPGQTAEAPETPEPQEPGAEPRRPSELLPAQALALLNHGLSLDGVALRPAKVSWANEDQLRFVLREGRKRQIRRMCELVGLKVTALKRVRIGRITLSHLPVGQWRFLAPWERF
ncbi:MAG: pseudouridine synthase [Burkholderiaceae bacterium]|nr:pseudouridine synthase [Burkholderiaceae bacterium]